MSDYISPGRKSWLTKLANREKLKEASTSSDKNIETVQVVTNAIPMIEPQLPLNLKAAPTTPPKYSYNKELDIYVTYIKSQKDPVLITGEMHRSMHKAYSSWAGKESTVNEICLQFNVKADWLNEYKTVHGWTHSQDIFTPEELETKAVDTLVQDAIQYKRKEWKSEYEKKTSKETQDNADKWVRYERSTLRYIEKVLTDHKPYNIPKVNIQEADENYAIVLPVMDLHYGKGAWADETGQSYTRQECRELLHEHTSRLLSRFAKFGRPEKIITCCGSDWLHIDTSFGTTTKGTPQDMDGTPGIILKEGMELAVEHIDLLRQIAPVEIVMAAGNHDEHSSIAILMFLYAWYRDCEDVVVHLSLRPRNYTSYGNTLLAFSHGDETKIADLCKLIPHEAKQLWSTTDNAALFTGHKHYEQSSDDAGISVYQAPSLSGADKWHAKKGYVLSRRALTGYIIYEDEGPGGMISSAMSNNDKFGFKVNNHSKKR